jgi:hypothetical protein
VTTAMYVFNWLTCITWCSTRREAHSQVASQGTGVVNVHNVDKAMHRVSTSTSISTANLCALLRYVFACKPGCPGSKAGHVLGQVNQ